MCLYTQWSPRKCGLYLLCTFAANIDRQFDQYTPSHFSLYAFWPCTQLGRLYSAVILGKCEQLDSISRQVSVYILYLGIMALCFRVLYAKCVVCYERNTPSARVEEIFSEQDIPFVCVCEREGNFVI